VVFAIDLLAQGAEGLAGEDGFDGEAEVFGKGEGKVEGGGVVAALEKSDGLVIDVEGVGEVLTGEAAFSAEDGDTVKEVVGAVGCGAIRGGLAVVSLRRIVAYTQYFIKKNNGGGVGPQEAGSPRWPGSYGRSMPMGSRAAFFKTGCGSQKHITFGSGREHIALIFGRQRSPLIAVG